MSSGGYPKLGEIMRVQIVVAIILIALGIMALAFGGFSWRSNEKVVDLGPVEINKTKTHTVPIQPILGGLFLVGGVALLVTSRVH